MSPKEDCLPSELHENSGFQVKLSYQKIKLLIHLVSMTEQIVQYYLLDSAHMNGAFPRFHSKEVNKVLI